MYMAVFDKTPSTGC